MFILSLSYFTVSDSILHENLLRHIGDNATYTEDQRAITPGQSMVFYSGDICLGGAIIS